MCFLRQKHESLLIFTGALSVARSLLSRSHPGSQGTHAVVTIIHDEELKSVSYVALYIIANTLLEVTPQGNRHKTISSNFFNLPLLSGMICMVRIRLVQRRLQNGSDRY